MSAALALVPDLEARWLHEIPMGVRAIAAVPPDAPADARRIAGALFGSATILPYNRRPSVRAGERHEPRWAMSLTRTSLRSPARAHFRVVRALGWQLLLAACVAGGLEVPANAPLLAERIGVAVVAAPLAVLRVVHGMGGDIAAIASAFALPEDVIRDRIAEVFERPASRRIWRGSSRELRALREVSR